MKATGIVRSVDDLGRITVPKEVRRTLKISPKKMTMLLSKLSEMKTIVREVEKK